MEIDGNVLEIWHKLVKLEFECNTMLIFKHNHALKHISYINALVTDFDITYGLAEIMLSWFLLYAI